MAPKTPSRRVNRRSFLALIAAGSVASAKRRARGERAVEGVIGYGKPKTFQIEHSATVTNRASLLSSLELWLPIPQDQPEQTIQRLRVEPRGAVRSFADLTGTARVAKLYATRRLPGPGRSATLTATYHVTAREIVVDREALARYPVQEYRRDRTYRLFTRPEQKIETQLPAIAAKGGEIARRRRPVPEAAREAYEWVLDRTRYQLIDGPAGAAYCLANGHGECGEYAALFVAVCRAAGIPARPVVGFWADKTNGWHVWAEFMLPSGEWIPVDPSIGDQNERNRTYCFGNRDNRRVGVNKTFDVFLQGSPAGRRSVDFLQVGAWWWTASTIDVPPTAQFAVTGSPL